MQNGSLHFSVFIDCRLASGQSLVKQAIHLSIFFVQPNRLNKRNQPIFPTTLKSIHEKIFLARYCIQQLARPMTQMLSISAVIGQNLSSVGSIFSVAKIKMTALEPAPLKTRQHWWLTYFSYLYTHMLIEIFTCWNQSTQKCCTWRSETPWQEIVEHRLGGFPPAALLTSTSENTSCLDFIPILFF